MFPGSRAARPSPPLPHGAAGAERGAPNAGAGLHAAQGAGRRPGDPAAGPRARRSGRGRAGLALGRAFWLPELIWSSRCFIYYYCFCNGQACRRPSPKGAEALLGGRGGRRGPARLWHDCRAPGCHFVTVAVVPGWGGAQTCAIAPTAPDVEAAGGAGSGDPQLCSGPQWGSPPLANGLRLCWSVAAAVAPGGRRSSRRVLPPPPSALPASPAPLLASISSFLLQAF